MSKKLKVQLAINCKYGRIGDVVEMPEEDVRAFGPECFSECEKDAPLSRAPKGGETPVETEEESEQKEVEKAPADKQVKKEGALKKIFGKK